MLGPLPYAAYVYLIWCLIWLEISRRRNAVSFDCAIACLVWFGLAQIFYVRGEVEQTGTAIAITIYLFYLLLITWRYPKMWLPWFMIAAHSSMLAFNAAYGGDDALFYKQIKNGIFISEMAAIAICWWSQEE